MLKINNNTSLSEHPEVIKTIDLVITLFIQIVLLKDSRKDKNIG
jgi:hypothetical protein